MKELTEKQARVLAFIVEFRRTHAFSPTFAEIAEHIGVTRAAVSDYIAAIEKKGHVVRYPGMHRGVIPVGEVSA